MAVFAKRLSGIQRAWLINYEEATTFEPMHQDEIDSGAMTFNQVARANIEWFKQWSSDAILEITNDIPLTLTLGEVER